jgi:hypothetical protein
MCDRLYKKSLLQHLKWRGDYLQEILKKNQKNLCFKGGITSKSPYHGGSLLKFKFELALELFVKLKILVCTQKSWFVKCEKKLIFC